MQIRKVMVSWAVHAPWYNPKPYFWERKLRRGSWCTETQVGTYQTTCGCQGIEDYKQAQALQTLQDELEPAISWSAPQTLKSHASASSAPPPKAKPFTTATVGMGSACRRTVV